MNRIDGVGARPNLNGIGKNGFHDNADLPNQDATHLTPKWLNQVQEELCNLLEKNGVSLNDGLQDQLYNLLATEADLLALATATQQKLDQEKIERQDAVNYVQQNLNDAINVVHDRINAISRLIIRPLSSATTRYPVHYQNNPINYDAVLISAHYQPGGVLKQTMRVHSTLGDANLHVYLPVASAAIVHINTTYQSAGYGSKGDDDSYSRLVDLYEEGPVGAKQNVIVVRTDYVSPEDPTSIHRWIWIEVTSAGYTQVVNDLNDYPYSRNN
ncbi:hypothetical protein F892_03127 [Acinetobacter vivianii]|uniref:Uncharacterized protein n=1 Tax=Acinetobacter vivianii TaxID=1776742 RepID=N9NGK0_9GAMM|nr:hypothetical protein [Acinetobacter vivianii]ENX20204.1 hypothetical protein F892_03127 [Acinetobacter vivianii]GGI59348.1 hypothetical protein GCM10011446_08430 [Acinetobacter vivianii]